VIRYASYTSDIGLNFSSTAPSLAKYLKEIRMKQGFFPDRVAREFATGKFRKFAYMPTDDHRFVLETGITGSLLEGEYISLRPNDTELVAEITEFNPALVDVEFFPIAALKVHNPELLPDPEEKVLLDQLARERKSTTIIDTQNDRIARYLYVYLNDPTYGSDMSVIVRLTYNTALTTQALNRLLLANLIKILFVLAFSAVFAVLISRRVSRPVEGIVEDLDRIARGDLTHQVATSKVREFIHLGWHIDAMVQRLRETIQKIETRERDLMQSEERYRAVVETQTETICRFAPDGTHLFVNEAYCRYFGRQCEEIVGHRFIPNIPPEELDLVVHHFGSLTQRAPVGTIEHRIILPDGTVRWQQWVDRALFADDGSVLEYQSVGRDITERKHAESALRQANIKLNVLTSLVRNEIQSGLFILRGYLYLLGQEGMNDHDQPVLEKAKEVSIRMNDLIQFSRSYIDLGSQPPSWQGVHQTIIYAISHLPTKGIRHRIACENIEIYADPFLERAAFRLASRSQLHEPTHVIAVSCIKRGGNLDII
jgi:PAS domain S-box-containing protein